MVLTDWETCLLLGVLGWQEGGESLEQIHQLLLPKTSKETSKALYEDLYVLLRRLGNQRTKSLLFSIRVGNP